MGTSATDRIQYERIEAMPVDPRAHEYMVRMRDGVRLATDVYLPEPACGPGPTILIRLPYDKNGDYTYIPDIAAYFAAHGYRVAAQDVRGKFRSEGETILWVNEAYDGYDTLDWIVNQPWSDGVVGMWGDSYYGFTQLAAASTAHSALRAIAPRVTGTRLGDLPERNGSAVSGVEMTVGRIYPVTHFQSNLTYEWKMDLGRRPLADLVEEWFSTVGERSPSYDLLMPHPVALRRFPAGHPFDAPAIPILQTIGWWDNCAPWQWADHALIAERAAWARNEYLLLEDIDHENNNFASVPYSAEDNPVTNASSRAAALPRYLDPAIAFFDVFLRGARSAEELPRVRWRVAGEAAVRSSVSWPPPDARERVLYAVEDRLDESPSGIATERDWVHDPDDLVPSPVMNAFEFLREYPDERGLALRGDVLAFDGEPAGEPQLLAGPVSLRVTIRSTGPEMDLFARLTDVSPEGATHLVARGQLTLHDPARPTPVEIDMGHVGYRLATGHRMRLTIASSDFPEFVPAPGTGEHRWL
ncbi:MAG TPA: CocE/NonD family hydrolase, partial [Solirubrobacteraceae bacterium]|nr:CocE/NonD family hydrolase [Solirubrobacteraceae bacterium]